MADLSFLCLPLVPSTPLPISYCRHPYHTHRQSQNNSAHACTHARTHCNIIHHEAGGSPDVVAVPQVHLETASAVLVIHCIPRHVLQLTLYLFQHVLEGLCLLFLGPASDCTVQCETQYIPVHNWQQLHSYLHYNSDKAVLGTSYT